MQVLSAEEWSIDMAKPEWVIPGVVPKNAVSLLWGESGAGKSFWAIDMSGSKAAGIPWAGIELERGRVLYVPTEDEEGIEERKKAWERERGVTLTGDTWRAVRGGYDVQLLCEGRAQELANILRDQTYVPDLIVIDTLGAATETCRPVDKGLDNPGIAAAALAGAKALQRRTGAGVLLIAHPLKDHKTIAGAAPLYQGSAMRAYLSGKGGNGETQTLECKHVKRGCFPDIKLTTREVPTDDGGTTLVIEGGAKAPKGLKRVGGLLVPRERGTKRERWTPDRWHEALCKFGWDGATPAELGKATGRNDNTALHALQDLVEKGLATSIGEGHYRANNRTGCMAA